MQTPHAPLHQRPITAVLAITSKGDGPHAAALTTCADDGLAAFLGARQRLFRIAYRMLGSAAEAEDIVQDVWVRWQTTDRSLVRNSVAFLVTATTRLAINVRQSARARRETPVGPSMPEPVDTSANPDVEAERGEALNSAMRLLLEKLSPTERAAYVLREAFHYPCRKIAHILRLEEANARQLVARARKRVSGGRRAPVSPEEQRRLLDAFVTAMRTGDLAKLESLFASDVVSTSEDEGSVRSAQGPAGRERVAQVHRRSRRDVWSGVTTACIQAQGQRRGHISTAAVGHSL